MVAATVDKVPVEQSYKYTKSTVLGWVADGLNKFLEDLTISV